MAHHSPNFANEHEIWPWLRMQLVDQNCIDNYRFAYVDDVVMMQQYANIKENGCCGFFDTIVHVNNRKAKVGCNYGH